LFTLDIVDEYILSLLGKNGRISASQLSKDLHDVGEDLTDRAIRHRLRRLEKGKIILGYSPILNPIILTEKASHVLYLKFNNNIQPLELKKLDKYIRESTFCPYVAKLSGEYDYICHFIHDSQKEYELEFDSFFHMFKHLVAALNVVLDLENINNIMDKLQLIVDSLVKYFEAKFAHLWIVNKSSENLILKFIAGDQLTGIYAQSSTTQPMNSTVIEQILRTSKPAVTNDVVNDPRTEHLEWARKQNLRSFAGYPVISIISDKRFVYRNLISNFCFFSFYNITQNFDSCVFMQIFIIVPTSIRKGTSWTTTFAFARTC
jgi:DNA-binding Lrp family transcriptional regulator